MHGSYDVPISIRDEKEEVGISDDHAYLLKHLVETIDRYGYSKKTVLDYGCNRDGFLQTIFNREPFRKGIGIDVAERSLAKAGGRLASRPIDFIFPRQMDCYTNSVDTAFSHEVLYLISDLDEHAASIARVLKTHGAYYAAIGCHTSNPLWPRWRELTIRSPSLQVFDYSLDDYARAFWKAGFRVDMRPYQIDDFVLIKRNNSYFPTALDSLDYHSRAKMIIRVTHVDGGQ